MSAVEVEVEAESALLPLERNGFRGVRVGKELVVIAEVVVAEVVVVIGVMTSLVALVVGGGVADVDA